MAQDRAETRATADTRFTSTKASAEDLLKSQTVGLVQLSDFRKRRAELLETQSLGTRNGSATPAEADRSRTLTPESGVTTPNPVKKKQKLASKGKLSFELDDEDEDVSVGAGTRTAGGSGTLTPSSRSRTPATTRDGDAETEELDSDGSSVKRKLGPNTSVSFAPRARTKHALLKEAQTREQLRKEFLAMQTAVKATEMVLPFVFYDGANIPGGRCRIRKGEHVWLFLDKARKVGAELGVDGGGGSGSGGGGGTSSSDRGRREWARVSVDDLMLVRHDIIVPHHYEFYHFLVNKTATYEGKRLFALSAEPTATSPSIKDATTDTGEEDLATYDPLAKPSSRRGDAGRVFKDEELEGYSDDPSVTKVVDRRWYERNKHIYPASTWEEFDAAKDYAGATKKDAQGNSFFFS